MNLLDRALALADEGIPAFPCLGNKRPACDHGFKDASIDPVELRTLFSRSGAALVGYPTGPASGRVVLDIDPRHGGDAWERSVTLPPTRIAQTGGGRRHYIFRNVTGLKNSAGKIAPGVDIRATGGYVIDWPHNGAEVLDMPDWLVEAARGPAQATNSSVPTREGFAPGSILPRGEPAEMLALAIARIEAAEPGSRYEVARGMAWQLAPHALTGAIDAESTRAILVDAAGFAGGKDPELVGRAFDDAIRKLDGAVYRPTYGAEFCALPPEEGDPATFDRRSLRDRIVRPTDCADGPRRGYIVKGLLAPGDVAAVIGQPGCGKSVWAPHLAYGLAQGRRVFGLRTKPGAVLYLAAEDFSGMHQRVAALKSKHGDAALFGLADIGNLRDAGQADELLAYVEAEAPALVVIDTLGAAWAGMDENGAQDMSAVVELARRMSATGAAVMVVHHTPKNGDGTPRGHSVLNGTLDLSVMLDRDADSGIVHARLLKNRNGTPDIDMAFRVEAVALGEDEDGDAITAPIAFELTGQDRPKAKLSPVEQKALLELRKLGVATEDDWCAACDPVLSTSADAASRNRAFRRARAELTSKGYIELSKGAFSIVGAGSEFDLPLADMMG